MRLGLGEWSQLSEGPGDLVGGRVPLYYSGEATTGTGGCDTKH